MNKPVLWKTGGCVDSVNVEQGTLTVWLRSFDELQTIPITDALPEWMLHEGVWFNAEMPTACLPRAGTGAELELMNFERQPFSDLTWTQERT